MRASSQEIRELSLLAKDAPGLAKPLRQFLETIDQRDRAVEPDERAAATDPPAPDKTHIASGTGGFTGMEAIWNYFYWQALGTNALDNVGKVLRLGVTDPTACLGYANNAEAVTKDCNQWLGPTQPGITTPDPTLNSSAAAAAPAPPAVPAPRDDATTTALTDYLLGP